MPEEIVDLTGSRINDERYANNVIFDKDGLNELLGKIRDYPIVDVDYISENENDEINNNPIWKTYTNDTPCIKVIYGDKTNANGNLSDADLQSIRELKKQIALYNNVRNLYNKYAVIEKEYKTLIQNIQNELKNIVINVCNTYHNYLNSGGDAPSSTTTWYGTYYMMFANARGDTNQTGINDFIAHVYPGANDYQGLYYKIEFKITQILDYLESIIANNDEIDTLQFYNIDYTTRGNSIINPEVNENTENYYVIPLMGQRVDTVDDIKNIAWTGRDLFDTLHVGGWTIDALADQVKTYNNLLQQTIEILTYKYIKIDATGTPNTNIAYYTYDDERGYTWQKNISNFDSNTDYYIRQGSDGTDHIRTLLATYAEYIRQARVDQMEAIRQYLLTQNVNDGRLQKAVTAYNSDEYNNVASYVNENYLNNNIDEINNQIQDILNDAVTDKYEEASSYAADTQYYELDNDGRFMPVSIANEEAFTANSPLYKLKSGAPAIYGYKYVKVGSNIRWDDNKVFPIISNSTARDSSGYIYPEVDPESEQRNGHFRVNINGHVYEVGVKGLEDSTTDNGIVTVGNNIIYEQVANTGTYDSGTIYYIKENGVYSAANPQPSSGEVNPDETYYIKADRGIAQLNPVNNADSSLGTSGSPWDNAYITTIQPSQSSGSSMGTSDIPYENGYFKSITIGNGTGSFTIPSDGSSSSDLGIGNLNYVTDKGLTDKIIVTNETDGIIQKDNNNNNIDTSGSFEINSETAMIEGNTSASINTSGGIYAAGNIWASRVFNAVFNDYAEYRTTCKGVKPGQCVYDNDDGSLSISDKFLVPGAQIVSDTFGHTMGMTEKCTTPVAVAGRVLAYPYQDRKNYHAGMCVCAAPGGTVNIMSRKDIQEYPDCIVGIVSEIPEYETWGSNNIKVDGRIWIKVK